VRIAMLVIAISFCLPLWAEDKEEVWPEFPVVISVDGSQNLTTVTLDMTVANIRLRRNQRESTDQVDMSYRVIGSGTNCLRTPFLLGLMVKQWPGDTVFTAGKQEIYFQVHYLTSRNSVRYYQPLMANAGLQPTLEIERWELLSVGSETKLQLRGLLSTKGQDVGIGIIRKIGRHLEIKVFTNDPRFSLVLTYELTGLLGR